jgi:hypothetical protein
VRRRWLDVTGKLVAGTVESGNAPESGIAWLFGPTVAGAIHDRIGDHLAPADCEARFLREWSGLTRQEKLTLTQLADEGLVNHRQADVVADLVDWGILTEEATIRFRDPRMRKLTLQLARLERVREWEAETRPSAMTRLEMPIALVLGVFAAFLYLTQRDLWITVTSLVGAAASATPWVTRMASSFSSTRLARIPSGGGHAVV